MINSAVKDQILTDLVNSGVNLSLNVNDAASYGINRDEFRIILDQLENLGLCSYQEGVGGKAQINLTADAFDFFNRGGFTAKEAHEKASLEKLQLEIQTLQKSFPEKADLFTGILAHLATVSSLFLTR